MGAESNGWLSSLPVTLIENTAATEMRQMMMATISLRITSKRIPLYLNKGKNKLIIGKVSDMRLIHVGKVSEKVSKMASITIGKVQELLYHSLIEVRNAI